MYCSSIKYQNFHKVINVYLQMRDGTGQVFLGSAYFSLILVVFSISLGIVKIYITVLCAILLLTALTHCPSKNYDGLLCQASSLKCCDK